MQISAIVEVFKPIISAKHMAYLRALHSLNLFKRKHSLTVDPKYEISPWFTFGSLCAVGSVETALNTSFFAVTSEGLIRAAGTAAQVSATNVLIGFGVGYLLIRYSLHVNRKHRLWTIPMSLITFISGVTFNIAMGSYREHLQSSAESQKFADLYIDVIRSILDRQSPGLSLDLSSFILIVAGLTIFFFSTYKGVKHNDPYPEYASRHLRFLETDEDLALSEEAVRQQLGEAIRSFGAELTLDASVPSVDRVQEFLDGQSDRITKMIAETKREAGERFANENQENSGGGDA
jgi:hypothetical protein